jgi:hypothetical protein
MVFVGEGVEAVLCIVVRDAAAELLGRRVRDVDTGDRPLETLGVWLEDPAVSRPGMLPRTTRGTMLFEALRREDGDAGIIMVFLELVNPFPAVPSMCVAETDDCPAWELRRPVGKLGVPLRRCARGLGE